MERTLILLKPDCVQRRLVGRILTRFEDKGLNIIAMRMMHISPQLAKKHYAEHVSKGWYPTLEKFITGGPIVAAIIEGLEAIRVVRDMLGATNGLKAAAGTIRGDFSSSRQMNLVHASDGPEAAAREIVLYFSSDQLFAYEPTITPWLRGRRELRARLAVSRPIARPWWMHVARRSCARGRFDCPLPAARGRLGVGFAHVGKDDASRIVHDRPQARRIERASHVRRRGALTAVARHK